MSQRIPSQMLGGYYVRLEKLHLIDNLQKQPFRITKWNSYTEPSTKIPEKHLVGTQSLFLVQLQMEALKLYLRLNSAHAFLKDSFLQVRKRILQVVYSGLEISRFHGNER